MSNAVSELDDENHARSIADEEQQQSEDDNLCETNLECEALDDNVEELEEEEEEEFDPCVPGQINPAISSDFRYLQS